MGYFSSRKANAVARKTYLIYTIDCSYPIGTIYKIKTELWKQNSRSWAWVELI